MLAVSVGPVFFALLQTSVEKGFRSGMWLAVGISLSDALYAIGSYVGFSQLADNAYFKESLAMAGGVIMIIFGISAMIKTPVNNTGVVLAAQKNGAIRCLLKGFALNAINPSVIIFWVGMITLASVQENFVSMQIVAFLSGIILTVFVTDVTKAYVATRLKHLLTQPLITWMNRVVGVVLFGFGVQLIYFALSNKS